MPTIFRKPSTPLTYPAEVKRSIFPYPEDISIRVGFSGTMLIISTAYNLRFKGFVKVNQWLSINTNTDFSTYNYKYPLTANSGSSIWETISSATQPVAVLKNPDGTLTENAAASVGDFYLGKSFLQKQPGLYPQYPRVNGHGYPKQAGNKWRFFLPEYQYGRPAGQYIPVPLEQFLPA